MPTQRLRVVVVLAVALVTAFAGADRASADGVVLIDGCQTLSTPNTVYKLTADIVLPGGNCLIVAADRITIDMQGHSITTINAESGITDLGQPRDLVVVKNGTIGGVQNGVTGFFVAAIHLASTRVSVIAVIANNNNIGISLQGAQSLVKASTASFNGSAGIVTQGDRSQVQQSTANDNGRGISAGDNCLVTMNTANGNATTGIRVGAKCTASYNTANGNSAFGIIAALSRSLITHNTAVNNGADDFIVSCPGDVTFNTSTDGFPASYILNGNGCKTVGNE